MRQEERTARARRLLDILGDNLRSEIPAEVLAWPSAHAFVAGATADLVLALAAWEWRQAAADVALARTRAAYEKVQEAWRAAARAYARQRAER